MWLLNGNRIYGDIITGGNLLAWSVCSSSSRKEGDWVKGVEGGIIFLASCEHHFVRLHENLLQHPSNNISIGYCH